MIENREVRVLSVRTGMGHIGNWEVRAAANWPSDCAFRRKCSPVLGLRPASQLWPARGGYWESSPGSRNRAIRRRKTVT